MATSRFPAELVAADFAGYPPEGRRVATENLPTLRQLPMVLAPFVLHELAGLDWKMPAERRTAMEQLRVLREASAARREELLAGFRSIDLRAGPGQDAASPVTATWLSDPASSIEALTAWLWSTHRMERFREVAGRYAEQCAAAGPAPQAPERLGLVVIGQGAPVPATPLFARLAPKGVRLTRVDPTGGVPMLLDAVRARAAAGATPFAHWYIDGGQSAAPQSSPRLTQVAYAALQPARDQLLARTTKAISSGEVGPESLRALLAHLQPGDLGLPDDALSRFQVSLLTEGSGTQVFATTFVQWAAREAIRRAEPETLLLRFAPRQQAQSMDAMLGGTPATGVDAAGSLVDADEAAWLTWINLGRLPSKTLRYLVWHEGQHDALVIGPGLPGGTTSTTPLNLSGVLQLLT